jgi:hypothetical protein
MRSEHMLVQALSYIGLIAAVLEYAILVRHRAERRTAAAQIVEAQETGLRGLVRVFLVDEQPRQGSRAKRRSPRPS